MRPRNRGEEGLGESCSLLLLIVQRQTPRKSILLQGVNVCVSASAAAAAIKATRIVKFTAKCQTPRKKHSIHKIRRAPAVTFLNPSTACCTTHQLFNQPNVNTRCVQTFST